MQLNESDIERDPTGGTWQLGSDEGLCLLVCRPNNAPLPQQRTGNTNGQRTVRLSSVDGQRIPGLTLTGDSNCCGGVPMVSGWCAVSAWCRRRWDDLTQGSSLRATRFGFPRHRLCLREDGHMHAPRVHVKGWWGDVPEHEVRPPADDPRVGGGAASALRHRDVSMRRRQAVAR